MERLCRCHLTLCPFSVSLSSQAQDIPLYSSQFTDTQTHWANVCIEGIGAEGLMKGYLDGSFKPDGTITRAEFAAVMIKAFPDVAKVRKAPNFSDVAALRLWLSSLMPSSSAQAK